MMVDMYGQGFQFDVNTLLRANQHLELPGRKEDDLPNSEFVGDQARMELQAYYAVRKELAEYMADRIHEGVCCLRWGRGYQKVVACSSEEECRDH